jgi:hypothetical protein
MRTTTKPIDYRLDAEASSNGQLGKGTILVIDNETNRTIDFCKLDIADHRAREKAVQAFAKKLRLKAAKWIDKLRDEIDDLCNTLMNKRREQKAQAEAEAAMPPPEAEQISESEKMLRETPAEVRREAEEMLRDPSLIRYVAEDIAALGVAGERDLGTDFYLIGTSRKLENPVSGRAHGPSSSGKSHVLDRVAEMFPPEDVVRATAMTPQSLHHMPPGSLQHKFVVGGERSLRQEADVVEATRALREMLSAGRLSKLMPVKVEGGRIETVLIKQEGPIAFAETTTLAKVFDEDSNRCIFLETDTTPEQTRLIYAAVSARYSGAYDPAAAEKIIQRHRTMQRLLRGGEVVIPYAELLADKLPAEKIEGRRAIGQILGVVSAVALLYQFQRELDGADRVVATKEDYLTVKDLLSGPMALVLGGRVSVAARGFYTRLLNKVDGAQFSTSEVAKGEHVSGRAVLNWLHELSDTGYVVQVEEGRGRKPSVWKTSPDPPGDGRGAALPDLE